MDYRESDDIEVSLLWNRHDNTLVVYRVDTRDHSGAEIPVGRREPRQVFQHPTPTCASTDQPTAATTSTPVAVVEDERTPGMAVRDRNLECRAVAVVRIDDAEHMRVRRPGLRVRGATGEVSRS